MTKITNQAGCFKCGNLPCKCNAGSNSAVDRLVKVQYLLHAAQMAYRKHVLNDESVGWHELEDTLLNALCEVMGDKGFAQWLDEIAP